MKKTKLLWLTMAMVGTVASFAGCGEKEHASRDNDETSQVVEAEGDDVNVDAEVAEDEPVAETFGARMLSDYPLSGEAQTALDSLDTSYKKVNWTVAYAPSDNGNIVVSETEYSYEGKNYLVLAFTNLSDEGLKFSYEGYAENFAGDVFTDLLESDVELGPKNTIVQQIDFDADKPSGNIKWNNFAVTASDEEYMEYNLTWNLEKDNYGDYRLVPTCEQHSSLFRLGSGYGCVLDADGNIILGKNESTTEAVPFYVDTFGGENADSVYYANYVKL